MELGRDPLKSDHFAGYIVDDSDLEYSDCSRESSDDEDQRDEVDKKQSFPSPHSKTRKESGTEEDEFEQEMDREADLLLARLINQSKTYQNSSSSSRGLEENPPPVTDDREPEKNRPKKEKKKVEYYDDIYFDDTSSEDEDLAPGQEIKKRKSKAKKVRKLTNDELFYDPHLDDEDEKWVEKQRRAYRNVKGKKDSKTRSSGHKDKAGRDPPPSCSSDAVLNCPACMSTLSLDCQRHDVYPNQFRAMFVLNCKIVKDEILHYKTKPDKRKRGGRGDHQERDGGSACASGAGKNEVYYPVKCSVCDTEVAVLDNEQVFHFFNVLASPP